MTTLAMTFVAGATPYCLTNATSLEPPILSYVCLLIYSFSLFSSAPSSCEGIIREMKIITDLLPHPHHHHDPTGGSHLTTRHHDRKAIQCGKGRDWVPILV
ncbi:hypothetical protein BDV27DRAFT_136007 [Aspergillus caelatus]|uniref:Uncharacterized protein n=2 Tax=Aspergillus subgen. Circumdati TaxID=2720871 RepID=A0A5N6ZPG7_9EURO|nr:uncharacterized protein BDV27DRAFT_136007 [Aspergillus caelatus]KAE8359511.1 hypothetical protein BDV27DRAFT_136007 [Aspergillus caelatus]KAE8411194.1 hypothetical protein BDV36DRAFT_275536 [Aspergillus pseudocaelatus]